MALRLSTVVSGVGPSHSGKPRFRFRIRSVAATVRNMAFSATFKELIDSYLHVWASLREAGRFSYSPGQEPTLPGNAEFLLQCMEEAGVDGALIVQPINHKFDHSYVPRKLEEIIERDLIMNCLVHVTNHTYELDGRILEEKLSFGAHYSHHIFHEWHFEEIPDQICWLCCLSNPADDGSGLKQFEDLVLKDGYRAVRFNPYLWQPREKVHEKFSSLFRVSRAQFPYLDLSPLLSQVVSALVLTV